MTDLPDWYDTGRHRLSADGIYRRSDNALLAADGLPMAGPLRQSEARAAPAHEAASGDLKSRKKGE